MNIEFSNAHNGLTTFCVNSIFYHSKYDPQKEAERFCHNLHFEYNPEIIILFEPGLSYCYKILKEKFPNSKIGIIRIIEELNQFNNDWDFVINSEKSFQEFLNNINEIQTFLISFQTWQVSLNLFKEDFYKYNQILKNHLEYSKTLLTTREYFEKKWLLNSFNFIKNIQKTIELNSSINCPILIAASGPSLYQAIPLIKKNQNKFFLIAVSSGLYPLLKAGIHPDILLTTDGGYWAGQHLKYLNSKIIIATTPESYFNKSIFNSNYILPLIYPDGLSAKLLQDSNLTCLNAQRNGTVTGTALEIATNLTNKEIYLCGVDMKNQKGFQHTQPNQLEINNSLKDNKITSKEKRIIPSEFNSGSLEIYRQWFNNFNSKNQVYRVIEDASNPQLGNIKDITFNEFNNKIISSKSSKNINFIYKELSQNEKKINLEILKQNLSRLENSSDWIKNVFPADFLALNKITYSDNNINYQNLLHDKIEKLIDKLKRILINEK